MRSATGVALCGMCFAGAGACDIDAEEGPSREGKVQLGTGVSDWEPLLPDQQLTVRIEESPCLGRGGWVIVHARVAGMEPGDPALPGLEINPTTTFSAFGPGGARVDTELPPYRLGYEPGEDGFHELVSGRLLLMTYEDAIELDGERLRLRVEVTDVDGRFAEDERWVVGWVER